MESTVAAVSWDAALSRCVWKDDGAEASSWWSESLLIKHRGGTREPAWLGVVEEDYKIWN